jgi:serine/threonine protein kinase
VAIKQMILSQQPNPQVVINEILLMKDCNHPAIVNFIDSYLLDGVLWVVMEFMDGSDLTSVIEACHPFEEHHISTICREVSLFFLFFFQGFQNSFLISSFFLQVLMGLEH